MNTGVLFVDRDGVINSEVNINGSFDSPMNIDQVCLVEGIENLIGWANNNNIKVVEITNQPAVAKGKISMETLSDIEKKVDLLLVDKGVKIDKKYICYHHPNAVVPEYKMECNCRKPKPGMLMQAAKDLNIDLKNSVMIGDRDWDVEAGKSAGCKTILFINNTENISKVLFADKTSPDFRVSLMAEVLEVVKRLMSNN